MQSETLTPQSHSLIASDRVEGTPVRRSDGEKIGTIERLMIDKISGNVAYAVLSFGGFLGMGQKHAPIPWTKLSYDPALGAYHLDLSEEELRGAPSVAAGEEFDWGDRSREVTIHNYYRVPPYWGAY
jgi:PRC-barrel domain